MESLEEVLSGYGSRVRASVASLRQIRGALKALTKQNAAASAPAAAAATAAAAAEAAEAAAAADAASEASTAEIPPIEAAQLHVTTAFAACTLWFAYLKTQGLSTQSHPVSKDLARVQHYMLKVSRAIQQSERRPTELNSAAAGRFITYHTGTAKRRSPQGAPDSQLGAPEEPLKKRRKRRGAQGAPQTVKGDEEEERKQEDSTGTETQELQRHDTSRTLLVAAATTTAATAATATATATVAAATARTTMAATAPTTMYRIQSGRSR
ncbi:hypothetical protein Esti_006240 [Eimeria stiedai]